MRYNIVVDTDDLWGTNYLLSTVVAYNVANEDEQRNNDSINERDERRHCGR